jgi:hypothetical protein
MTAFVAIVEPCTRVSISAGSMAAAASAASTPSVNSGGVDGTLLVTTRPSGRKANRSVNVPPTSIPTFMRA